MIDVMTRKQAAALGIATFFTKKKCKYGHTPERYTSNGNCVGCRHSDYRDNREEKKRKSREWRAANPEKAKAAYDAWYSSEENKNKKHACNKRHVEKNREAVASRAKKWYEANKAELLGRKREWYKENREKILTSAAEYRAMDPNRMKRYRKENPGVTKAGDQNRRARKKKADGYFTAEDIKRIARLQKHKCAICRNRLMNGKAGHHIDHIVPLARGGDNWPSNLQLLCPPCNLAKHARDPIEHMQSLGFLL